eukprot:TRINITY_DN4674_c0_g1_i1.p1 TRINITY_DN4674_c0_g1~~TRINITY_DN4674_c0_g1_i1.p1  ORF type:complete len:446 (-),score=124.56 TRINITY_DN4674_c0_g1_i1:250-1587(-)
MAQRNPRIAKDVPIVEISTQEFLQNNKNAINWMELKVAEVINEREHSLLSQYMEGNKDSKSQLIEDCGHEFAKTLLNLASNLHVDKYIKYILCLIDEMLELNVENVFLFANQNEPYKPFYSLLERGNKNSFVNSKASKIISQILVHQPDEQAASAVFFWCGEQLQLPDLTEKIRALNALQILLRNDDFRLIFDSDDGLNRLGQTLNFKFGGANKLQIQVLYQTLFCFWLMSYNPKIADSFGQTNYISKIIEFIRSFNIEKVTRVGLAILVNLLNKGIDNENNQQMIENGVMRVLEILQLKNWSDEDVISDLEKLTEVLEANIVELSSFDIYQNEVESGSLDWNNPAHKSEKFWRENVMKFENDDFYLLGILINILEDSQDATILAIALNDLGQFLKFHPRGRLLLIRKLNAKAQIMEKLTHQDPEVQRHALLCTQKLLIVNWEYL